MNRMTEEQIVKKVGITFSDPKEIPNEKPDETIQYGTFEDLLLAAGRRCVDEDAAEIEKLLEECKDIEVPAFERDITGTLICPGYPKLCLGSDNYPAFAICCDECDHFLKCFPEAMPGETGEPKA